MPDRKYASASYILPYQFGIKMFFSAQPNCASDDSLSFFGSSNLLPKNDRGLLYSNQIGEAIFSRSSPQNIDGIVAVGAKIADGGTTSILIGRDGIVYKNSAEDLSFSSNDNERLFAIKGLRLIPISEYEKTVGEDEYSSDMVEVPGSGIKGEHVVYCYDTIFSDVAISRDGRFLAFAGFTKVISDVYKGSLDIPKIKVKLYSALGGIRFAVRFRPIEQSIFVIDTDSGNVVHRFVCDSRKEQYLLSRLCFGRKGHIYYTSSDSDGSVKVCDSDFSNHRIVVSGCGRMSTGIVPVDWADAIAAFNKDGGIVVFAFSDGNAKKIIGPHSVVVEKMNAAIGKNGVESSIEPVEAYPSLIYYRSDTGVICVYSRVIKDEDRIFQNQWMVTIYIPSDFTHGKEIDCPYHIASRLIHGLCGSSE